MAFETINLGTQPAGTGGDTARSAFEKTNRNFLAAEVLSAAMSQAQFEAIRAQNKERDAASAWVSFGNHEAGKQVNECKPGLYTALTTPNTLLIGKAGGVGGSKTDHGVLCIAGVIFHLPLAYPIRLARAPDGKTTYKKSNGVITNHATVAAAFNAQAADPVNVEVVINRVDMWGFEAFPQEVTPANPEIYPQGVFSDLFTSMNGITTSDSARPVSYFGFLGKPAKKIDFFALSDAQKKKVLADPKNNLYYSDDGRLIQWLLRGREFAGAGNGDWLSISSASSAEELMYSSLYDRVRVQGAFIDDTGYAVGEPYIPKSNQSAKYVEATDPALYYSRKLESNDNKAVNGECYFLVCGTVNRLGQGAYHPSFNPSGAAANDSGNPWYGYSVEAITSTLKCFTSKYFGNIGSGNSGRPDDRFYDAIYANGQGGVCRDMRYSAYGIDVVNYAEADQRVKNATYRGFEKTKLTTASSSVDSNISVGGNFLVTEVIATNAAINATAALSSGWSGFKNAQPPTGSVSVFELSRDAVSTPTALRSTNNGTSWSAFTPTFNAVNNSVTLTNEPAANIVILQYQAFAKQTEPAPNAALADLVPYNVFASSDYRSENGALLGESLIGKVLKNNSGVTVNNKSLLSCAIDGTGKLTSASNFDGVTHSPLTLGAPANNSPAFKVVSYLANINQQAVPHFAYTELRHNGTSFGDDGKQTIVDNQATKPNDHGVTVSVGTARLREPLGWFKKKV